MWLRPPSHRQRPLHVCPGQRGPSGQRSYSSWLHHVRALTQHRLRAVPSARSKGHTCWAALGPSTHRPHHLPGPVADPMAPPRSPPDARALCTDAAVWRPFLAGLGRCLFRCRVPVLLAPMPRAWVPAHRLLWPAIIRAVGGLCACVGACPHPSGAVCLTPGLVLPPPALSTGLGHTRMQ